MTSQEQELQAVNIGDSKNAPGAVIAEEDEDSSWGTGSLVAWGIFLIVIALVNLYDLAVACYSIAVYSDIVRTGNVPSYFPNPSVIKSNAVALFTLNIIMLVISTTFIVLSFVGCGIYCCRGKLGYVTGIVYQLIMAALIIAELGIDIALAVILQSAIYYAAIALSGFITLLVLTSLAYTLYNACC
jgi:hypothetical protein